MKLLFVHDHIFVRHKDKLYSNTFSYDILKRYLKHFSSITFVARYKDTTNDTNLPISSGEGIEFVLLESISNINSFFILRHKYKQLLGKLLENHDKVIVRLPSEFGLLTAHVAKQIKKPYMVEVVGCGWDAMWNYGGIISKIYAPFLYFKMKQSIKNANYSLYVTKNFLQKRYPTSSETKTISVSDVNIQIYNDVLPKRLEKISKTKHKIVFGTIANLDMKYKSIDIAIKTIASLRNIKFEYRIVGPGNYTQLNQLVKKLKIEDKIYFEGVYSSNKKLNLWLDNIDIYIQPSKQEGLPRALLEAMSRGCPIIASNVGGIPELIDNKMLFSYKQLSSFEILLKTLSSDIHLMKQQAIANYNKSLEFQSDKLNRKRDTFLEIFKNDKDI